MSVTDETVWKTVHRVVFPVDGDTDTLPLYVDFDAARRVVESQEASSKRGAASPLVSQRSEMRSDFILGRRELSLPAHRRVSFGTYFNAFPASYWRAHTDVQQVRLSIEVDAEATVIVYKSSPRGSSNRVQSLHVTGGTTATCDLTLTTFADGGWYWFDLVAHGDDVTLKGAHWSVPDEGRPQGRVTLGVTTFNRADYCLETIKAIDADSGLREILAELIIVDQGNQKVADEDGFDAVAESMGDQLRIINQGNLGGSGGFARNMYEMVVSDKSDYVMLLDDDIELETEGVMRAVAFADLCRKPTIVGGHMFDMYNKSVLHAYSELVNFYRFLWGPVEGLGNHDFSAAGLRSTPQLHRRWDADYNGWWMCLIPKTVVETIGLSLPVFIKWDDAEYSLRGRAAGFPTVTLPGAAVWHVSWADKDDSVDWQAYYHERNRLIATLLHSPFPKGGRILRESLNTDVKHLVSMQYYPEQARIMALRDVLAGPGNLHQQLPTTMPKLRAMREEFQDSQVKTDPGAFPEVFRKRPPKKPQSYKQPGALGLLPWAVKTVLKQTLAPVRDSAKENPEAQVAHQDGKWWSLAHLDSAVVSNADGTGASWHLRDPKLARQLVVESAKLHAQLFSNWETLRAQYREALPEITSMESWRKTFEASEPSK
jgi:galactofuranosylgalactofuranosylrhamnosyl-N-acetylglucosaminyl-diphospho-decaprenol beta-1,5/1,6-galactofuranosyltransferase